MNKRQKKKNQKNKFRKNFLIWGSKSQYKTYSKYKKKLNLICQIISDALTLGYLATSHYMAMSQIPKNITYPQGGIISNTSKGEAVLNIPSNDCIISNEDYEKMAKNANADSNNITLTINGKGIIKSLNDFKRGVIYGIKRS